MNKCSILFLFTFLLGSLIYAQQVSITANNVSLDKVLDRLSEKHQFKFSYDPDLLKQYKVSISSKDEEIESFLSRLLEPYHLQFKRSKKQYFYIQSTRRSLYFKISDKESSEAIPFATIHIQNSHNGTVANSDGFVEFSFDRLKDTAIVIRSLGYREQVFNPQKLKGDTASLEMEISTILLKMPVILEYLNKGIVIEGDVSTPILKIPEMEVLPGLPEPDVLLSTQMLPGFESNDETAAGINVRGSSSAQSLIYWDRIPVYQSAHYFGQITSIIPSLTDKVQAYKNYVPTYFTGSTAGMLNISSFDSIPEESSYTSNTNFTHTDLSGRMRLNSKTSLLLGGRLSYNHLINTPLFDAYSEKLFDGVRDVDDDEGEVNSTLRFWDINAKLIYEPDDKTYFSISAIANQDELEYNGLEVEDSLTSSRITQDHNSNFFGINTFLSRQFNHKWSSSISASFTDYELSDISSFQFNEEMENSFDSTIISNELSTWEIKTALNYHAFENHEIQFGYQLHQYNNTLRFRESNEFEAPTNDSLETTEILNSIYLQSVWNINQKLVVRPQFRFDYFRTEEEFFFNPLINIQYELSKGFWLKSSYGLYTQALNKLNESTLTASNVNSGIWVLAGEEDTDVLRSRRATIGALYQQKGWIIDVDAYNKQIEGVSAVNIVDEAVNEDFQLSLGSLEAFGIDLMIKKNFGRYHSWLSYTFSETTNLFDSIQNSSFPSSLDRPHQFRWVHTYIINQFELSLGFSYKSGAPFSRANSTDYDAVDDEYRLVYNSINNSRLPDYHRMDFSLWYRFPRTVQAYRGVLGLSVMNIYNRGNVWKRINYLEDTDDDGMPEILEEERFFLAITPNITLRLNF